MAAAGILHHVQSAEILRYLDCIANCWPLFVFFASLTLGARMVFQAIRRR